METSVLLDFAFGAITLTVAFIVKRIFILMDRLQTEDKTLHSRITDAQMSFVSKKDFEVQVERIINAINRLESKMER
mgnify:CR=1 FL=1|tara:strand:- start:266 stop:496 length:231 start_codon:yes stop_codon:yes gene_type:complete